MRGVELLQRCGVDWNAMAVVNDFNAQHPLEFYRFFKTIGCDYLQFTPILERIYRHPDGRLLASPIEGLTTAEMAPFSVSPKAWGNFLCTIFEIIAISAVQIARRTSRFRHQMNRVHVYGKKGEKSSLREAK